MDIPPAVMRDLESLKKIVKVDQANGFAQGHMDADQNHPQPWARQHHANRQTADGQAQVLRGQRLQHLGVSWEFHPAELQGLFVDRCSDHGGDFSIQGCGCRRTDGLCSHRPCLRADLAHGNLC